MGVVVEGKRSILVTVMARSSWERDKGRIAQMDEAVEAASEEAD